MNPVVVAIAVAFLGGLIAYLADRLGRILGKKRLSLLGMRPRHTAEFLTVCAGAFIPIVTILIVMGLSAPVREWLLHSGEVLKQRDELEKQLKQETASLQTVQDTSAKTLRQVRTLQTEGATLRGRETDLKNQVGKYSRQVNDMTVQLGTAGAQVSDAKREYEALNEQLTKVRMSFSNAQKSYANTKRQYDGLQRTLANLQTTYNGLQASYSKLKTQRDSANAEVATVNSQLATLNQQLTDQNQQLSAGRAALMDTQSKLTTAQSDLTEVETALRAAEDTFKKEYGDLGKFTNEGRYTPFIFGVDEELARTTIPAGSTPEQARGLLESLIADCSEIARERGTKVKSSDGQEAGLITLPDDNGDPIPVSRIEDQLVRQFAGKPFVQVAIARAYFNTTVAERVPIEVFVYDDPLVYHKNATLAETLVHGDLSNQRIFEEISNFLRDKVQQRAKRDKMIPASGQEESFGEVAPGDVVDLVEKIHSWGRAARLIAMAKEDTRAGDTLHLKFDLRQ